MSEPKEHPLSVTTPGARWLDDVALGTVVLLWPGGMWTEVDSHSLEHRSMENDREWSAVGSLSKPLKPHRSTQ